MTSLRIKFLVDPRIAMELLECICWEFFVVGRVGKCPEEHVEPKLDSVHRQRWSTR